MEEFLNKNLIYNNQDGIEYIQFKKLLQYPEVSHCYTLRSNGELNFPPVYKDAAKLSSSYKKICNCLNLNDENVVKPHQTHTDRVEVVNKVQNFDEVDGLVTNKEELVLLTTSADCTSMLLYDPIKKAAGSVHSGWKGTLQGIVINEVEKMVSTYGSKKEDIICCICPSIRQCCFEVDEDVKDMFYKKYSNLQNINDIIQKGEEKEGKQKYYIDTVKINEEILRQAGLKQENIIDSEICTMCHSKDFHSYRVDKENSGRNAALIAIRNVNK